jgi:hypothetical protein
MIVMESILLIGGWYLLRRNGVNLLSLQRATSEIATLSEESELAK